MWRMASCAGVLVLTGLLGACGSGALGPRGPDGCVQLEKDITTATTLPAGCYDAVTRIAVTAPLTLDPGVTLHVHGGSVLVIGSKDTPTQGRLVARGTAGRPISIGGTGQPGSFGGLILYTPGNVLDHVTLQGGGTAAVDVYPPGGISVSHSTVEGSLGVGIRVELGGALGTFMANTLTGNGAGPLALPADQVGKLDTASDYAGNHLDEVSVYGTLSAPATWRALGVPYWLGEQVDVQAALTLEPGVTLDFDQVTPLTVGAGHTAGSLHAVGTAAEPITFQGSGQPGSWAGIEIFSHDPANVLTHCVVRDGGNGTTRGFDVGLGQHAYAKVTQSVIGDSSGYGLCVVSPPATLVLDTPDSNAYAPPNASGNVCPP